MQTLTFVGLFDPVLVKETLSQMTVSHVFVVRVLVWFFLLFTRPVLSGLASLIKFLESLTFLPLVSCLSIATIYLSSYFAYFAAHPLRYICWCIGIITLFAFVFSVLGRKKEKPVPVSPVVSPVHGK